MPVLRCWTLLPLDALKTSCGQSFMQECTIPDIFSQREEDPECFTDGVGIITLEGMHRAMRQHWAFQRNRHRQSIPSAIQIRFGGAKGMLCLWDNQYVTPDPLECKSLALLDHCSADLMMSLLVNGSPQNTCKSLMASSSVLRCG
jgi:hypothetical protein